MKRVIPAAALSVLLAAPVTARSQQAHEGEHGFVLTGAGRFAILADRASVERDGDGLRMRALQVAEEGFEVAGQPYWGGWSWWRFDCGAKTADRLDFASVKVGGAEGPATPDEAPPYPAAPGGDAAELMAVACDPTSAGEPDADSLVDAVRVGREALRLAN